MKMSLKPLNLILVILTIWLAAFLFVNARALRELLSYGIAYQNYSYLSKDPIPHKSDYGILYPFTSLISDTTALPVQYINKQAYSFNDLPAESKVNFRRMMFILKYLKSSGIEHTIQLVPAELRNFQAYTCNIFINPSGSTDFRLITAHYDVVSKPNYHGALDNSAAVIVLLNLLKKHLDDMKAHKVAVLLTTLEEEGLLGAESFMQNQTFNIKKVICLDGIGRGSLAAMNNSNGSFGFKFKNWRFKDKIFTGSKFMDSPEYQEIDRSVIDFNKFNIKALSSYLSSTDARIFSNRKIPTVNLVSDDIVHLVKVLHTEKDNLDGLDYKSLVDCESVLAQWIKD